MQKIKDFLKKYWFYIAIVVLFLLLITGVVLLINSNSNTKDSENLIKSLSKENKILLKDKEQLIDSMEYFHLQALIQNSKDTIYINKISYLKTKTNEEINSVYNLPPDSQYHLFTKLSEEFITGLNNTDSL